MAGSPSGAAFHRHPVQCGRNVRVGALARASPTSSCPPRRLRPGRQPQPPGRRRDGTRHDQRGRTLLQASAPASRCADRQRRAGHRRRRPARAGDHGPVPSSGESPDLQVTGPEFELRALPVPGPVRQEIHGRQNDTVSPRPKPYSPTAADLQAFAGRYESGEIRSVFQMVPGKDGLVMRFELSPDKALEFRPVDRDAFQARQDDGALPSGQGRKGRGLRLQQSGGPQRIKFTGWAAAPNIAVSARGRLSSGRDQTGSGQERPRRPARCRTSTQGCRSGRTGGELKVLRRDSAKRSEAWRFKCEPIHGPKGPGSRFMPTDARNPRRSGRRAPRYSPP